MVLLCVDYALVERPLFMTWMQGGADHIVLKKLDVDMDAKTGNFNMKRKKLFQLMGKAVQFLLM